MSPRFQRSVGILALPFLLLAGCSKFSVPTSSTSHPMIYGEDNRKDLYEITDPVLRGHANAVGVILHSSFVDGTQDPVAVGGSTLGEDRDEWFRKPVCSTERFKEQIQPGMCSGFLISNRVFATAGHCAKDIETLRVILNFSIPQSGLARAKQLLISRSQIYSFKRVIDQKFETIRDAAGNRIADSKGDAQSMDYAFLELDRPVQGAEPLEIESVAESRIGDPVVLMGHPFGLPLKYADGAQIVADEVGKYFSNFDGFHGNSGSPVLNARTGKVLGIYTTTTLIPDWSYDPSRNCVFLTRAAQNFGGDRPDEGVVKFTEILARLSSSVRSEILSVGPIPTTPDLPSGSAGTCVSGPYSNGFDFMYSSPTVDTADSLLVQDGAIVEVLGDSTLTYKGSSSEGIRLRVISNPGASTNAYYAQAGVVLWTYKSLFRCH